MLKDLDETVMSIKELIEWMNLQGYSQREFANLMGVTQQGVSLWLTGRRDFGVCNTRIIRLFKKYPQLLKEFGRC